MAEHHTPEILRLSLQDAVLRVKIWEIGDITETLGQAIDPPSNKNAQRAIDALKEIGVLTRDEELTPLGRNAARLPVDVSLGKLVILGIVFGCLDAAITIAAMISTKSLFLTSSRENVAAAEKAKLKFSRGDSDLLLHYNAYLAWVRAHVSGNAVEFCRKSFLDHKALIEVEEQKFQLLTTVVDDRILAFSEDEKAALRRARGHSRNYERFTVPDRYNFNNSNDDVLNSLIATSFYPKLLRREGLGWRNVSTNQHVSIVKTSVNRAAGSLLRWLSFHQAMQTKGHLNVSITSSVPEKAIILLLGDGDVKIFAGVIAIDGSRLRFHVHDWKTGVAIKILRTKIQEIVVQLIRNPSKKLSHNLEEWNAVWQRLNTQKE
jgi:ATP-dependent RNA helicase DHX29